MLRSEHHPTEDIEKLDSYEKEEASPQHLSKLFPLELPSRDLADRYIEIYFSTIHVAYPFICQQTFRQDYAAFWQSRSLTDVSQTWFATLRKYGSFPQHCLALCNGNSDGICHWIILHTVLINTDAEFERSRDVLFASCIDNEAP